MNLSPGKAMRGNSREARSRASAPMALEAAEAIFLGGRGCPIAWFTHRPPGKMPSGGACAPEGRCPDPSNFQERHPGPADNATLGRAAGQEAGDSNQADFGKIFRLGGMRREPLPATIPL